MTEIFINVLAKKPRRRISDDEARRIVLAHKRDGRSTDWIKKYGGVCYNRQAKLLGEFSKVQSSARPRSSNPDAIKKRGERARARARASGATLSPMNVLLGHTSGCICYDCLWGEDDKIEIDNRTGNYLRLGRAGWLAHGSARQSGE